jgi:hypothetical protein
MFLTKRIIGANGAILIMAVVMAAAFGAPALCLAVVPVLLVGSMIGVSLASH